MSTRAIAFAVAACALLGGCAGVQSALDPAGLQASRMAHVWWIYFDVCAGMFVVVLVGLVGALLRQRAPGAAPEAPRERSATTQSVMTRVVVALVVISTALLVILMLEDFRVRGALHDLIHHETMSVKVTGHQWWWELTYADSTPANIVTTANEMHLPVGEDVRIDLESHDVIHSLWIPNLSGKIDLIPGHPYPMYLRADRAGTWYGQCAEFCGLQHATMRIAVVAEPKARFAAWLATQRRPAPPPATDSQRRGQQVFLNTTCIMCHSIGGTNARSRFGPDLTHVGSRIALGAITIPNDKDHMMGWIANPQNYRPGVRMPANGLAAADLGALADYLESLK